MGKKNQAYEKEFDNYIIDQETKDITNKNQSKATFVHEYFEEQVLKYPNNTAIVYDSQSITYAELNDKANQLAHYLISIGVTSDQLVAVYLDRSIDLMVSILAILKAGGAYVPLDPSYPRERINLMLEDMPKSLVITHHRFNMLFSPSTNPLLFLDTDQDKWLALPSSNPSISLLPENLVYVVYTSGSTGKPKGTLVPHKSLGNFVRWYSKNFPLGPEDRVSQFAPHGFDAFPGEIWPCLTQGATLYGVPSSIRYEPEAFHQWLMAHHITLSDLPAAIVQALLMLPWPMSHKSLRWLKSGGDKLVIYADPTNYPFYIVNTYGPTEATIETTMFFLGKDGEKNTQSPPIGKPLDNCQVYLLDAELNPVKPGEDGELYICGEGLTRGYLNRPDVTADKFIANPFITPNDLSRGRDTRMYKTGDKCRILPDGNLEFIGRVDFQVKIRGFRVELGEIESNLLSHDAVQEAVVVASEDEHNQKRLIAYLILKRESSSFFDPLQMRTFLGQFLPAYMIPVAYVVMECFPLTERGKLDRSALPMPKSSDYIQQPYSPPNTEIEIELVKLYEDLLKVQPIGVNDSFVHLGGDSLIMTQLVGRCRELGIEITLQNIHDCDTPKELAKCARKLFGKSNQFHIKPLENNGHYVPEDFPLVELSQQDIDRIISLSQNRHHLIEAIYPLAPMQAGMLFHYVYSKILDEYLIQNYFKLTGPLDKAALQQSWQKTIDRHAMLRAGFFWEGVKEPIQVIFKKLDIHWQEFDWSDLLEEDLDIQLQSFLVKDRQAGFVLTEPPLCRFTLIRLSQNSHYFIWSIFHGIIDAWPFPKLLNEVMTRYNRIIKKDLMEEQPLKAEYSDYICWLKQQDINKDEAFWRSYLKDIETPSRLPFRNAVQDIVNTTSLKTANYTVTNDIAIKAYKWSKENNISLSTLIQTALALVISYYTQSRQVIFGLTFSGRPAEIPWVDEIVGCMINTLPFCVQIKSSDRIIQVIEHIQALTYRLIDHQHTSLAKIQNWSALGGGVSLFDTLLIFENTILEEGAYKFHEGEIALEELGEFDRTNYPLTITVYPDRGLRLKLDYDESQINVIYLDQFAHSFIKTVAEILDNVEAPVSQLQIITHEVQQQILTDWNSTEKSYPKDKTIHLLFEEQVQKTPDNIALIFNDEQLTYNQLNINANQLAHYLRNQGVGPDKLVAICMDRSQDLIVGLLAIMKAGGAYVPIDPSYPIERIRYMLENAQPIVVLTQERLANKLPIVANSSIVEVDKIQSELLSSSIHNLRVNTLPQHLAYVIYTSGSTGKPKGIGVTHQSVVNMFEGIQDEILVNQSDSWLAITTISFDIAGLEIYLPLHHGAKIILTQPKEVMESSSLERLLVNASIMQATPSTWKMLLESGVSLPKNLKVLCGGEPITSKLRDQLVHLSDYCWNVYGPTETTIWSTISKLSSEESITLGHGLTNTYLYILSSTLDIVPPGVIGELYIGGDGLARGYFNRPDITAERFIANPYVTKEDIQKGINSRLYKTGDLCRWTANGEIEYLERVDHQVKIRGFRIELGEIEANMINHKAIKEVLVIAREDELGYKSLLAYYVKKEGTPSTNPNELREFLSQRLPDYMIPSSFIEMEAFPLTPNGKLDRNNLPVPELLSSQESYVPPGSLLEQGIVSIWEEVLHQKRIGIKDNFFTLGGHSLLATQVVSRIRSNYDFELPLEILFKSPTVEKIAQYLEKESKQTASSIISIVSRDKAIPLSFAQQRLWFLDQLKPGNAQYNIPLIFRLEGSLDIAKVELAIHCIVERHEVLRTNIIMENGKARQIIAKESKHYVYFEKVSSLEDAKLRLQKEVHHSFDLAKEPLLRVHIFQFSESNYIILFNIHHIVADEWSLKILIQEFSWLYEAYLSNKQVNLDQLVIQYADFTVWQHNCLNKKNPHYHQLINFWKNHLDNAPTILELPTDKPRPLIQSEAGASCKFELTKSLSDNIRILSLQNEATMFMTLLSAFYVLLYRYSGQEDIIIGSPIANRTRKEIEGLIGFFVNVLGLRGRLDPYHSFIDLLKRVKLLTLEAYDQQDLPFERLIDELKIDRSLNHHPLFQVMFVFQNEDQVLLSLPELKIEPLDFEYNISKFDLTLIMTDNQSEGILRGEIEYSTDLFVQSTIERMIEHWKILLDGLVANPHHAIAEIPLLTPFEEQQLLGSWNQTTKPSPQEQTIVQLFQKQVAMSPKNIALVFGNQSLSYKELDIRANQLANYLHKLGIGPEKSVTICLNRSLDLIVSIFAILKVGAAYVPIDPEYPLDSIEYRLSDSKAFALIADSQVINQWPQLRNQLCIVLEEISHVLANEDIRAPQVELSPQNLAYVIYTSGSTGRPKGVCVDHLNLVNSTVARFEYYKKQPHSFLLIPSCAFDSSIGVIFWTLCAGGTLVIPNSEQAKSSSGLTDLIYNNDVSHILCIPSLYEQILLESCTKLQNLECVIVAGEECSKSIIEQHFKCIPNTDLFNEYGPTECTVWSTVQALSEDHISIGKAIINTKIYILDTNMQPVPIGIPGELYIGGAGVSRGYLNRPSLTAEVFVPNPFSKDHDVICNNNTRLYKTGDLCLWHANGEIKYLGRADNQIKIRGFRIELGEVESCLLKHPSIKDVAVIAREDEPGTKRLVAYIVPKINYTIPTTTELRSYLNQSIPYYMIPSDFVSMKKLPLMSNGKLDRKSLPRPEEKYLSKALYVSPRDELERIIARSWARVLNLKKISITDNFFELGGHSLLAIQLIREIKQATNIEIPLASLFKAPSVEQMAEFIKAGGYKNENILVPIQPKGTLPAFFAIHPIGGNVLCYHDLSRALGENQPLYGIQQTDNTFQNLKLMAKKYIRAIRQVQPQGPYLLLGWSLGGLIAFEMAIQLEKEGQQVLNLVLIDPFFPEKNTKTIKRNKNHPDNLIIFLEDLANQHGKNLEITVQELKDQKENKRLEYVLAYAKAQELLHPSTNLEEIEKMFIRTENNLHAAANYLPKKIHSKITLFLAGQEEAMQRLKLWSLYSADESINYHIIKEGHYSIMREPAIKNIVDLIRKG